MPKLRKKVRKFTRRAKLAVATERIARQRSRPIRPHTVLYESFAGNGVLCNPEAIFRYLVDHPDFTHLTHVWSIADDDALSRFRAEFDSHPRVSAVRRRSGRYWEALSTSEYLINNATFPPAFGKRPGQTYLNTWHGTPLKKMGFDMPDGAYQSVNTLRNFLNADFLLAANPFMAETMYEQSYRLDNIYEGELIEEGYPRTDRQHLDDAALTSLRSELAGSGIDVGDKSIVLYAPTWRGASFASPAENLDTLIAHVTRMRASVDENTVVLLKAHQIVHSLAADRPELQGALVPNTIPTNIMLGAASALITDYSSVFFDYLATGRPVVFFAPDADDYADARGTYVPLDEFPGPVTIDAATAVEQALALVGGTPHPRYAEWAERFTPFDDGEASKRVVDIVFRGAREGLRVRSTARDGRRRLLLYLGGMKPNGITSSALNLLEHIDHDRYDVTVLLRQKGPRATQQLIHPRVRQVMRVGGMNGSKLLQSLRRLRDRAGEPLLPQDRRWHDQLWHNEWQRVMGSTSFDWVADFSGYSPFWANLLLQSPPAERAIWLHNEMASDRMRTVSGRRPMEQGLGLVFKHYRAYDSLVSVSAQLSMVNRIELAEYASPQKFRTVRNFPSPLEEIEGDVDLRSVLGANEEEPEWMRELRSAERATRWFITVGRLSPEKNHARLIRAFAETHRVDPSARLLIVGGGPLHGALRQQISEAGLEHAAYLAGQRRQPSMLLAAADCFVMSSNYEGQPMVLLEAAMCEMPIVSTAFASVADALPEKTIHIVDTDDAALRDGLLAFLAGEVPPSRLDFDAYVAEVSKELEAVLNAE